MLTKVGRLLSEHRRQKGFSQRTLAQYFGCSKSKISKIESAQYAALKLVDLVYLFDDLDLELAIRVYKKGSFLMTRTGMIQVAPSHSCGLGFTIAWQSGALCTEADRNGATVEDVIIAAIARLETFHKDGAQNEKAIALLRGAVSQLQERERNYA